MLSRAAPAGYRRGQWGPGPLPAIRKPILRSFLKIYPLVTLPYTLIIYEILSSWILTGPGLTFGSVLSISLLEGVRKNSRKSFYGWTWLVFTLAGWFISWAGCRLGLVLWIYVAGGRQLQGGLSLGTQVTNVCHGEGCGG